MTATTEPSKTQAPELRLIPDQHVRWSEPVALALDDLPPDTELVGPPPGKDLVGLIEAYGQWEPVQVYLDPTPGYRTVSYCVIGGRRRIKAIRQLAAKWPQDERYQSVRAVVRLDDQEGVTPLLELASNTARKQNPLSDVLAIRQALSDLGEDVGAPSQQALSAISKATGMPYPQLVKRLKLVRLERRILEAAAAGQLSVGNAERIAKLPRATQEDLADAMEDGGELTSEMIHDATRASRGSAIASVQLLVANGSAERAAPSAAGVEGYLAGKLDLAMHEAGAKRADDGCWDAPDGRRYRVGVSLTVVE